MKKWKVTIVDTETDKPLFDGEVDAILATIIQGDDARSITALKTNTAGVITAIINPHIESVIAKHLCYATIDIESHHLGATQIVGVCRVESNTEIES